MTKIELKLDKKLSNCTPVNSFLFINELISVDEKTLRSRAMLERKCQSTECNIVLRVFISK